MLLALAALFATVSLSACRSGPDAVDDAPIANVSNSLLSELTATLRASREFPIELSSGQAGRLLSDVRGRPRSLFVNNDLGATVWASWARFSRITHTDKITFVRHTADGAGYVYVVYDLNGELVSYGDGKLHDSTPPWQQD